MRVQREGKGMRGEVLRREN